MKKLLMALVLMPLMAGADTWMDESTGYTWYYEVSNGKAEIRNGYSCAVSPKPSGTLTIPSQINGYPVVSIGYDALEYCSGLTSVTIPEGVTSIGSWAFEYCSGLTSVTIPSSVTSIGEGAFYGCSGLTSVTIPSSVTSIGSSAFKGCSGLTSVTIPSSVTSIGEGAFYDTPFYDNLPDGMVILGSVLYEYRGECPSVVTIPPSVTSIGSSAFYNCTGLTSVTIPEGVTSIGESAFSGCSGLTSVTIPEGVTSIGSWAFEYCSGLTSVTIPTSVTSIESGAFKGCSGLTSVTIPSSVTSIGSYAFNDCRELTSVVIPPSVTSIGNWAFEYCNKLQGVYITDLAAWWKIQFAGYLANPLCYAKKLYCNGAEVSETVVPAGLMSVGDYVFYGCETLSSVTIPEGVTNIGNCAFYGSCAISAISIPQSMLRIGYDAFAGCTSVRQVTAASLADWMSIDFANIQANPCWCGADLRFTNSYLPGDLILPDGLTRIDAATFAGCENLTSVYVPSSVTYIASSAFSGCKSLSTIRVDSANLYYASVDGVLYDKDLSELRICPEGYQGALVIPAGVTRVSGSDLGACSRMTSIALEDGNQSFCLKNGLLCSGDGKTVMACPGGMTDLVFPDGVTTVYSGAFSGCSKLQRLTIPGSVVTVPGGAFEGCRSLKDVVIQSGVSRIGSSAFRGCSGLESMTLPFVGTQRGGGERFYSIFGYSGDVPEKLATVTLTDEVTIPNHAFEGCKYIRTITLPIGVSSIGDSAFRGCESLNAISLPAGIAKIGSSAFYGCSSLSEVVIPVGVSSIESSTFYDCTSLRKVTLPVGLTEIGYSAFGYCQRLVQINIPNTVASIGFGAFDGCTGLGSGVVVVDKCLLSVNGNCPANVVIDKDVRLIVAGAFSECENLQSVTINAQIEELPDDLFEYCSNLKKVVLPASLRVIGGWAFCGCHSLEDIQLPEGLVEIQEGAFNGCASIRSFNIPASVTELWSLPTGWYDDWDEEVFMPSKLAKLTVASGNKVYAAYDNVLYSKDGQILLYCLPSVSSVAIRKGTKYITYGAFQSCSKLTDLTIPEGIVAIGDLDWVDEDGPSFDFTDGGPFDGCVALRSISLPSTIEYIYMGNPPSLTKLTVAAGNKYYFASDNVLYDKENSQLIYCPPALKTVKIWDKTESIRSYAFEGCAALESLTIPASVKKIGSRPFLGCEKLKVVYYKGDAPFPLSYGRSGGICGQVSAPDSWEEVDEEEAAKIQEWWELYLFDSWGGGCSPRSEFLNVTSYVQKGTKWWGDSGEWQGRPLVFVDSIENPVVKYVVSFDPCGGEATVDHVEIESGKAIGMLPTPTRSKYKFNGWYTAVEGGTKISSTTKVTGDVTYYAQWMYDGSATVVVNVGSGCAGMGTVSGGKMASAGTKVTLKATAKPGYVFAGWYRDEAGEEPVEGETDYRSPSYAYVVGEDDVTFYAKFIPVAEDWVGVWCRPQNEYVRGGEIAPLAVEVGSASLATVKVTGLPTGLKYTAKPMTLKATNNRAAVDLPANTIYGTPTKSGIFTATITATTAGKKSETYKVDFVVRGDGEYLVDVMGLDGADYPTNGSDMQHAIQWGKMSGYGAFVPGKTATLKATANNGYVFAGWFSDVACLCEGGTEDEGCIYTPAEGTVDYRSASFPVKVGYEDVLYYAKFVTAAEDAASIAAGVNGMALLSSGGETPPPLATNVMAGVYLAWPVAASALSLPTVKVAGLPSGLKFTAKPITTKVTSGTGASKVTTVVTNVPANTIYGAPSAASKTDKNGVVSPSKVKVTVTTSGKSKAEYVIDLTVDPLPAWAQGEFSGLASTPEGRLGSASMSVTAAGKVSGKVIVNGTNCTFSAASYDITSKTVGETNLVAVVTGKLGKETVTGGITVVASGSTGTFADADMTLFRNVWKDKGAVPVPEDVQGLYTVKLGAAECGTGYLSLTVDKNGAVKVAGKAPDGTALSGSATLIQSGEGYFADVFCAPSAYKGGYVAGRLEWSATGVVFALSALDWVSFNSQATMDYYAGGFVRSLSASGVRYVKDDAPKSLGVADVWLATPEGAELKTFSFTQSTGVWKGTLLWDFGDPSFDSVKVLLEGVMVQGEDLDGFGTYDVSASYIPYDKNDNPQQEKTYKVKESLPVQFSWE